MRNCDRDFYLWGAALDGFPKSLREPGADVWEMLRTEVLAPIGIHHARIVKTREADAKEGLAWLEPDITPPATIWRKSQPGTSMYGAR